MPQFIVKGNYKGKDFEKLYTANDINEIRERAKKADMQIHSIQLNKNTLTTEFRPKTPVPAFTNVPNYNNIIFGATILRIFAFIFYAMAALVALVSILFCISSSVNKNSESIMFIILSCIIAAVYFALTGVLIDLIAGISKAIKDIATNSFGGTINKP